MDFKQCKVLADIKYCEATNVEYERLSSFSTY